MAKERKVADTVEVQVRAKAQGFCNGRRRIGDEFPYNAPVDATTGKPVLGAWMELIGKSKPQKSAEEAAAERKAQAEAEQMTFAEGAAAIGADLRQDARDLV